MHRAAIALTAGLALADASVVTLALPPIVADLGASVEQAAAVLGAYALALAAGLPVAVSLRGRLSGRAVGVAGFGLLAAASAACGAAGSLGALVAFRALQAAGGALGLVAAFELLEGAGRGRRLWTAAAIFGTAAGPALGGALTQAFDWRAVFLAQVPVAIAGAGACARAQTAGMASRPRTGAGSGPATLAQTVAPDLPTTPPGVGAAAAAALALVSAALTGVLFLLVLLLVTGWSLEPLAAAAVVSVLPVAALAGARIARGRGARARACAGAALLGAGVLALAAVPGAEPGWTLLPQAVAGIGMGLALPALAGELLPERTPAQAAALLTARHLGIVAALAILAPIAAHQLDRAVEQTRERGAALVLDAKLPPLDKLDLVDQVGGRIDPVDPRGDLRASVRRALAGVSDRAVAADLAARADEAVVQGVDGAFRPALLVCGGLAVLAALLIPRPQRRDRRAALAAGVVALALAGAALLARPQLAAEPVAIADPCQPRALPGTGGIGGALQDAALTALDRAACRWGSSREALALALVDDSDARAYRREHGVDPRSATGLLGAALGL